MYFESLCGFGRGGASRALRERHHAVPRVLVHEVRASLVASYRLSLWYCYSYSFRLSVD